MLNYLLIASLCLITGLSTGFFAGYLLASLKREVVALHQENARLNERVAELETNGLYPKRRTHADNRRIEDAMADADWLFEEVSLLIIHHQQDARLEREHLEDMHTKIERLKTRLSDTRNANPTEYPE